MTREQREKLCEIMGYLWAKSDDALCASYAESIADMLAEDEKEHWLPDPKEVFCSKLSMANTPSKQRA